jgi:hypothetical protein
MMHPKVLFAAQQAVFDQTATWATHQGFYLAGGLALALQLGHRRSNDFDWFRAAPITDPNQLVADLEAATESTFELDQIAENTVLGAIDGVSASFFRYPYPMLAPFEHWHGAQLAAIPDIAAMKLLAIVQRGKRRDFIDLQALLNEASLHDMIRWYAQKYHQTDFRELLRALTYFEEADEDKQPQMLKTQRWATVKADILDAVVEYRAASRG